jgi:hypothetical protein
MSEMPAGDMAMKKSFVRALSILVAGAAVMAGCSVNVETGITGDATWTCGNTYEVGWMVDVTGSLTIEPGARVVFTNSRAGLIIKSGGKLTAVGTANARITFTSGSVQEPGAWQGIFFWEGSEPTTLAYCDFLYGGNDDLYVCCVGGSVNAGSSIQNCTFAYSLTGGLDASGYTELAGEILITGNTFHSNGVSPVRIRGYCALDATNSFHAPDASIDMTRNCIEVIGGSYAGAQVLEVTEVPYLIGNIGVGGSLVIGPGVVLKFRQEPYGVSVGAQGTVSADGTSSVPVIFTSSEDDSVMGDTNGDGVSAGTAGDWSGLFTQAGASVSLTCCVFRFGGYTNAYVIDGAGSVHVDECEIVHNLNGGIDVSGAGSGTSITGSTFSENNATASGPYDINVDGNGNVTQSGNEAGFINP